MLITVNLSKLDFEIIEEILGKGGGSVGPGCGWWEQAQKIVSKLEKARELEELKNKRKQAYRKHF